RAVPFVVRPPVRANERHKHHIAEILLFVFGFALAHELEQGLMILRRAHRHDQTSTDRKLTTKRIGNARAAGGDENGIEWLRFRPALGAVADAYFYVVVAEPLEAAACDLGQ